MVVHRSGMSRPRGLWNTVDADGKANVSVNWDDDASSTVHNPYHHYKALNTKRTKEEVGTT